MSDILTFVSIMLAGLVCGFIDSALGMGYGVSATSVFMAFGISPAIASASVHTSEVVVDIWSGISHWKLGNFERGHLLRLTLPGIIGALAGALFIAWTAISISTVWVSCVLLILGAFILTRFLQQNPDLKKRLSNRSVPLLGAFAAFVDVSSGGGWGPICISVYVLNGTEPRKAVGIVEITEPIISLTSVIAFGFLLGFESFLWATALPMILGGIILTSVAAILSKKIPKRWLGILIGVWLIILNARTLIRSVWYHWFLDVIFVSAIMTVIILGYWMTRKAKVIDFCKVSAFNQLGNAKQRDK
ncbi:sulfite exporter TauE/SafE family protein [Candidatus Bathyarchaeota archaeon]|nr:sulfite exporter TauE/SafE family protein [Candidatus Bathyarchaeota archaeon]